MDDTRRAASFPLRFAPPGLDLRQACVGQIGLGAAGSAIVDLAMAYGVSKIVATERAVQHGAVATTGRPGLIQPSMVRPGQVIFSLSNPDAEIDPTVAIAAGAAVAFDGRSINNALAFPGLFKAALETRSRSITREMCGAAAEAIAKMAKADEVVASPLDPSVHAAVTRAAADCARKQGLVGTASIGR